MFKEIELELRQDERFTKLKADQQKYIMYRIIIEREAISKLEEVIGLREQSYYMKFKEKLINKLINNDKRSEAIDSLLLSYVAKLYNLELLTLKKRLPAIAKMSLLDLYRTKRYSEEAEEPGSISPKQVKAKREKASSRLLSELESDKYIYEDLKEVNNIRIGKDKLTWEERSKKNKEWLNKMIDADIDRFFKDELDIVQVMDNIKDYSSKALYETGRLIVTEVNRALNYGAYSLISSGILGQEAEWSSILDDATCDDCTDMDGMVFNIRELSVIPPIHSWCRCILLSR